MDDGDEDDLCDALRSISSGQAAERQDTFQAEEPPTRLDLVADLMRSWYQREEDFKAEESD